MKTEPVEPFQFTWPDGQSSDYKDPVAVTARTDGKTAHFIIGKVNVPSLGRRRWRYNLFLTTAPRKTQGLLPVLDFVSTDDFNETQRLASLVKYRNGKMVRTSEPVPQEYASFELAQFNELVDGPYSRSGLAVVSRADDVDTMVRHAIIRSIQRGWLRW